MSTYEVTPIYIQSFYVQGTEQIDQRALAGNVQTHSYVAASGIPVVGSFAAPFNYLSGLTSNVVPVIGAGELRSDYQELGSALTEMTRVDIAEEWKVNAPVLEAAKFVASQLAAGGFPAPQIFNHGPLSIVFTWTHQADTLYLTVSADKVSALLSTPERIKRRHQSPLSEMAEQKFLLMSLHSYASQYTIPLNSTSSVELFFSSAESAT